VVWVERFSFEAVKSWKAPIDLLFIDGDHSEAGVLQDWEDWSPFVIADGVVISTMRELSTAVGLHPRMDLPRSSTACLGNRRTIVCGKSWKRFTRWLWCAVEDSRGFVVDSASFSESRLEKVIMPKAADGKTTEVG